MKLGRLLIAAAFLPLAGCDGSSDENGSTSDPASARCSHPTVDFGRKAELRDHAEVEVHFRCNGAVLAGTLNLPNETGRHPAVIYVHASGEASRWTWEVPWVRKIVGSGLAFFSYDKRGVGESEGVCCPGDDNHFNLLAADAVGAANALRSRSEIDAAQIGLLGLSQGGWIVPLATVRSNDRIAFTAIVSGAATTTHEEEQWSELAGEEADNPPELTNKAKADFTDQLDPSGFDPVPLIQRMSVPGLWLYGGQDRSLPADRSAETIRRLGRAEHKDFSVVMFPNAGHGLLDTPPSDPRAITTLVAWLRKHVRT